MDGNVTTRIDVEGANESGRIAVVLNALVVAVPAVLFVLHSLMFSEWIVDDAGISFSYARNLALGNGLVPQPGSPPVEGYSNFTWVLLFVPFFLAGVFHPVIVPKILSLILVGISFFLIANTIKTARPEGFRLLTFFVLAALALNTSFVVWNVSGLENPLFVALLCLLMFQSVNDVAASENRARNAGIAGLTAGLIALTRPEGIIFSVAYPAARCIAFRVAAPRDSGKLLRELLLYGTVLCLLAGSYFVFRLSYFNDLFPLPYYAKDVGITQKLGEIASLQPGRFLPLFAVVNGVAGRAGGLIIVMMILMSLGLALKGEWRSEYSVLSLFAILAAISNMLLPGDWMGEFRFATFLIVVFYVFASVVTGASLALISIKQAVRTPLLVALAGFCLVGTAVHHWDRSVRFSRTPTLPMDQVARIVGHKLSTYAELLGEERGSVLTPDIGGALYVDKLKVHDLGGLTDPFIAKGMRRRAHPSEFRQYVFESLKPTFIFTHGTWTLMYGFFQDRRFAEHYVPLFSYEDPFTIGFTGRAFPSGFFIRRDIAGRNVPILAVIRRDLIEAWKGTLWDF